MLNESILLIDSFQVLNVNMMINVCLENAVKCALELTREETVQLMMNVSKVHSANLELARL